jgi:hypothetical protein
MQLSSLAVIFAWIALVELTRFAILEYHQVGVFFERPMRTSRKELVTPPLLALKSLKRRTLRKVEKSLLRQEEVGICHDILEVRLAICVDKSSDVNPIACKGFQSL